MSRYCGVLIKMDSASCVILALLVICLSFSESRGGTAGPCSAVQQDTSGMVGKYIPQCTADGWYTPQQCHPSTGHCWCVTKNGTEIPETRHGPGEKPVSCDQDQTDFPKNVTFGGVKFMSMLVHWSAPSYNGSDITHYRLFYVKSINKNTSVYLTSDSLSPNVTRYNLTGLKPGTSYCVYVTVFYVSGVNASSPEVAQITAGFNGPDRPCDCDPVGSNMTRACQFKTGWCVCLPLAKGHRCDKCVPSAYKHKGGGCMPCHCPNDRSHGSCSVTPRGLLQCHCMKHTHGLRCDGCENGYYKNHNLSSCMPCDCNGNSEECDVMTGACQKCQSNTTGAHCHLCLPGCDGDALNHTCMCSPGVAPAAAVLSHHRTVVAMAISVTVIAALVIVAILVYKYCHQPSKPFTFWTVELRDDHENVNFSSLMEQPEFQNVDATLLIDDTRGSDTEDRRTIVKNTPYQPVRS